MMAQYLLFEVVGLGLAFGLGYLFGRGRRVKVKIPDFVPAEWKIGKGDS